MIEKPKLPKKALILANYTPPAINGAAICLFNIFSNFNPDSYCFLTSHKNFEKKGSDPAYSLSCHYFFYDDDRNDKRMLSKWYVLVSKPFRIYTKIRKALKIIKEERIEVLIGTTGRGQMLIFTYILSKLSGKPYCPYILDLYKHNNLPGPWKIIATFFEPILFRGASLIFLCCEGYMDFYKKQYPKLNTFRPAFHGGFSEDYSDIQNVKPNRRNEVTILFSGAIYWLAEGALDEVIEACQEIKEFKINILLYIPAPSKKLIQKYSAIPNIQILSATKSAMIRAMNQADILLIPYSWNTQSQDVVNTAIPSKLIGYLLSNTPILIHAPRESYISRYGRKNKFACVVDDQDINKIKSAIKKMIIDNEYTTELIRNAQKTFFENHDARINSKIFYDSLLKLN